MYYRWGSAVTTDYSERFGTLKQIIQVFGEQFLTEDGNLNRRKLGLHVFSNAQALKELNRITHTAITQEVKRILAHTDKAVIEGAAIHECEVWTLCDCCIFVSCPKEKQIERIMQRDHLTREYAEKRISAQKSDAYYRQKCDYDNRKRRRKKHRRATGGAAF